MKGQVFASEVSTFTDRVTEVPVTRLTSHKAHSYHLYFTTSGWYDDNSRLLFGSDRGNCTNLYSLELATGLITQLTDGNPDVPGEVAPMGACRNPVRAEAYFMRGRILTALDLHTLEERPLYEAPDGFDVSLLSCTADGRYVCTTLNEVGRRDGKSAAYAGYYDFFLAKKLSRLVRVATDDGAAEVLLENRSWMNHVNTSPTQPHLLTFCHEGPWREVEQRVWGYDLRTGQTWKVRPQAPGDAVGHEYWLADGLHVGYHGLTPTGLMYGAVRYDNATMAEAPFPHDSRHFHSLTLDLVVGDGRPDFPYILLWRTRDGGFDDPRVLCWHQGSWHAHQTHVHPRFSPDGTHILFTSDEVGYGNIYLAPIPDLETLPTLEDVLTGSRRPWTPFAWLKTIKTEKPDPKG